MIRLYDEGTGDGLDNRVTLIGEYTTNDIVSIEISMSQETNSWMLVTFADGSTARCFRISVL